MTTPSKNNDRIWDRALEEALGGDTPPDLSADIAARLRDDANAPRQLRQRRFAIAAAAACVVVGMGLMLWPKLVGSGTHDAGMTSENPNSADTHNASSSPEIAPKVKRSGMVELKGTVTDPQKAIQKLAAFGIAAKYDGKRKNVLVPAGYEERAGLILNSAGLLANAGHHYRCLTECDFKTIDKEQLEAMRVTLQSLLSDTLRSLDFIADASVEISPPQAPCWDISLKRASKATVTLVLRGQHTLTDDQVAAIAHLVANSYPMLRLEDVSIVDKATGQVYLCKVQPTEENIRAAWEKKLTDAGLKVGIQETEWRNTIAAKLGLERRFGDHKYDDQGKPLSYDGFYPLGDGLWLLIVSEWKEPPSQPEAVLSWSILERRPASVWAKHLETITDAKAKAETESLWPHVCAINDLHVTDSETFNSLALVRVVNGLHALGKDKALAVLRAYRSMFLKAVEMEESDTVHKGGWESAQAFYGFSQFRAVAVARLLFVFDQATDNRRKIKEDEPMAVRIWPPDFLTIVAMRYHPSMYFPPEDRGLWPCAPLHEIGGIPFLYYTSWNTRGTGGDLATDAAQWLMLKDYLDTCEQSCILCPHTYAPPTTSRNPDSSDNSRDSVSIHPLRAMEDFLASPQWQRVRENNPARGDIDMLDYIEYDMRCQALRAVRSVLPDPAFTKIHAERKDAKNELVYGKKDELSKAWQADIAALDAMKGKLVWLSDKQDFALDGGAK